MATKRKPIPRALKAITALSVVVGLAASGLLAFRSVEGIEAMPPEAILTTPNPTTAHDAAWRLSLAEGPLDPLTGEATAPDRVAPGYNALFQSLAPAATARVIVSTDVIDAKIRQVHGGALCGVDLLLAAGHPALVTHLPRVDYPLDVAVPPIPEWLAMVSEALAALEVPAGSEPWVGAIRARFELARQLMGAEPDPAAPPVTEAEPLLYALTSLMEPRGAHCGSPEMASLWRARQLLALPFDHEQCQLFAHVMADHEELWAVYRFYREIEAQLNIPGGRGVLDRWTDPLDCVPDTPKAALFPLREAPELNPLGLACDWLPRGDIGAGTIPGDVIPMLLRGAPPVRGEGGTFGWLQARRAAWAQMLTDVPPEGCEVSGPLRALPWTGTFARTTPYRRRGFFIAPQTPGDADVRTVKEAVPTLASRAWLEAEAKAIPLAEVFALAPYIRAGEPVPDTTAGAEMRTLRQLLLGLAGTDTEGLSPLGRDYAQAWLGGVALGEDLDLDADVRRLVIVREFANEHALAYGQVGVALEPVRAEATGEGEGEDAATTVLVPVNVWVPLLLPPPDPAGDSGLSTETGTAAWRWLTSLLPDPRAIEVLNRLR